MPEIQARLTDGSTIRYSSDTPLGKGAEKIFYPSETEGMVVGIYRDQGDADVERMQRLQAIVGRYNPTADPDSGEKWTRHFCWPSGILVEPEVGVLLPKFPANYYTHDGRREKKLKWYTSASLTRQLPEEERGDLRQRLLVMHHLAQAVARMHAAGLAHSDLSSNNVLVDLQHGTCLILDIDTLVVPGLFPPKVIGTAGYIAPEIVATMDLGLHDKKRKLPCIRTDLHSLAVIFYELFFQRHPLLGPKVHHEDPEMDDRLALGSEALFIEDEQDRSNRPQGLAPCVSAAGEPMRRLFRQAFTRGLRDPYQRPTALQWAEVIGRTLEGLRPCPATQCPQRWFLPEPERPPVCPFCGSTVDGLLFLRFFNRHLDGNYRLDDMPFCAQSATTLDARLAIPEKTAQEPSLAQFTREGDAWALTCGETVPVRTVLHGRLRPGVPYPVVDGDILSRCAATAERIVLMNTGQSPSHKDDAL